MPVNLLAASKPSRMLAFMVSVCSAYEVQETCFRIVSISSSLYSGAEPSSAGDQCFNTGTDEVSFHVCVCFIFLFFYFEFVPGTKRNVSGACVSQKGRKSWEIKKSL